jgi:hypothetical protein
LRHGKVDADHLGEGLIGTAISLNFGAESSFAPSGAGFSPCQKMGELNRCHDGEQDGPGGKDVFETGPFFFPVVGRHLVSP